MSGKSVTNAGTPIPESYSPEDEIDWTASWKNIVLRVELPFWLMLDDCVVDVDFEEHVFRVCIEQRTWELYVGVVTDSKVTSYYQGPWRQPKDYDDALKDFMAANPTATISWRKCKTVLIIESRCNSQVFNVLEKKSTNSTVRSRTKRIAKIYLQTLCHAHIPLVNKMIRSYRLQTYDYHPFEVANWDVPIWHMQAEKTKVRCVLVPYKDWDERPRVLPVKGEEKIMSYMTPDEMRQGLALNPSPGELELMDALNLMERGDYSGAIRRVTTAIEVILEAVVFNEIKKSHGLQAAERFVNSTRSKFDVRLAHYQTLTGRVLTKHDKKNLALTRKLRHQIVHEGYRLTLNEIGPTQRAVDTGRWLFNFLENKPERSYVRERNVSMRSLGRNMIHGAFKTSFGSEGVSISANIYCKV